MDMSVKTPKAFFLFFIFTLLFSLPSHSKEKALTHLCGPFYYTESGLFSEGYDPQKNEKMIICGGDTPGWTQIPISQSKFFIGTTLQSKGYYNVQFIKEGDRIIIKPGEKSYIRHLVFLNKPIDFDSVTYVGVADKPLTSENLDTLQDWSLTRLRAIGYPCPKVKIMASYVDEKVLVELIPGQYQILDEVIRDKSTNIRPNAYSRFDAFMIGKRYNGDFLSLSSRRMMTSLLVDYAYFQDFCEKDKSKEGIVEQKLSLGKPRHFLIAAGASTEEFPILQTRWRHSRLDDMASNLAAHLYLSSVKQSLSAESEIYIFHNYPRFYLNPEVNVERREERVFTTTKQAMLFGVGYGIDDDINHYQMKVSPTYNVEDTLSGQGVEHTSYLSLDSSVSMTSHYYEFYQSSPRFGHNVSFAWSTRREGIGSAISGDLYKVGGTFLYNWGYIDPPVMILGVRFGLATLDTERIEDAPPSLRLYLGGDNDMRGFARQSINNNGLGYKTSAFVGIESRFVSILPYQIQPFVFIDIGKVGAENWQFNKATLLSPGLGLRWQSPIGTFRGTAGRGLVLPNNTDIPDVREQWTFFLSFGQEF